MTSYCTPGNATCNYDVGSNNLFTSGVEYDFYGYNITEWNAIIFVAYFALAAVAHLGLSIWSRQWWLMYTLVLGSVGELVGWSARLISSTNTKWLPDAGGYWYSPQASFLAQISVLIFSPAFVQAGNYILLGRVIPVLGSKYIFIHPLSYTIIFVIGDLVGLIIQAIGGGQASAAETQKAADDGAKVMVAGVIIQMVVMVLYSAILATFVFRWSRSSPFTRQVELFTWWPNALRPKSMKKTTTTSAPALPRTGSDVTIVGDASAEPKIEPVQKKGSGGFGAAGRIESGNVGPDGEYLASPREVKGAKIMLFVCVFSTLFIFIRSVYRTIELLDGWNGPIITNQRLFDFLDGFLVAWSIAIYLILHPGFWLPRADRMRK